MIALEPLIAAFWLKGRGFTTAGTVAVSCNKFPGGAQRKSPPPKISVVLKKGRMAPFMKMANLFALQKNCHQLPMRKRYTRSHFSEARQYLSSLISWRRAKWKFHVTFLVLNCIFEKPAHGSWQSRSKKPAGVVGPTCVSEGL